MRARVSLLLLSSVPLIAAAHHSRSHYPDEVHELAGELVSVHWVNPHVGFTINVENEQGQVETWRVEGISNLVGMQRGGVSSDIFTLGERVVFAGSVSVRRARDMLATNILLENGSEILLSRNAGAYFSDDDAIRFAPRVTETGPVDAAGENLGLYRVWSMVAGAAGQREHFPYTDAAIAARAEWNEIDNYAERCESGGMPRLMRNPHPFEFVDRVTEIEMISELYDLVRIIHMDRVEPPAGEPASPLGYSVGRWEGQTLVVTTNLINWHFFDNIGTPQTEAVEIVERFTVSKDQASLAYQFTLTDPAIFSEPAVYERTWFALGERIEVYDCQVFGESIALPLD